MRQLIWRKLIAGCSIALLSGCALVHRSPDIVAMASPHQAPAAPAGTSSFTAPVVKNFPNISFPMTHAKRDVLRSTQDGHADDFEAWCNSEGDWGIFGEVTNRGLFPAGYSMSFDFGHVDNGDPATFVSYTLPNTNVIAVGGFKGSGTVSAHGLNDAIIRANFNDINAVRAHLNQTEPPSN